MIAAIRSLTGFGNRVGPSPDQCSTACNLFPEASPKAISGRTSYLHVRLEFHPYPHLILTLFNGYRFGPPHIFTCVSTWTWVDHCGFGSTLPDLRPLKTRFPTACKHTVSGSLSLPSRGAFHLSLTVLCAIGRYLCFALEGGPPCFPRDFSCPAVLWCHLRVSLFRLPGFHCLWHCFPTVSAKVLRGSDGPQPR